MSEYKAGPAMDARVAEEVIGLADVHVGVMAYWFSPCGCGYKAEPYHTNGMHGNSYDAPVHKAREPYSGQQLQCHDSGYEMVPDYSTDIAAAWKVVEWMHSKRWQVVLICNPGSVYCDVCQPKSDPTIVTIKHTGHAPTAPLAICLAALAAAANSRTTAGGE